MVVVYGVCKFGKVEPKLRLNLLTFFGVVFSNFNSTKNYILLQLLINMTNLHILIFYTITTRSTHTFMELQWNQNLRPPATCSQ